MIRLLLIGVLLGGCSWLDGSSVPCLDDGDCPQGWFCADVGEAPGQCVDHSPVGEWPPSDDDDVVSDDDDAVSNDDDAGLDDDDAVSDDDDAISDDDDATSTLTTATFILAEQRLVQPDLFGLTDAVSADTQVAFHAPTSGTWLPSTAPGCSPVGPSAPPVAAPHDDIGDVSALADGQPEPLVLDSTNVYLGAEPAGPGALLELQAAAWSWSGVPLGAMPAEPVPFWPQNFWSAGAPGEAPVWSAADLSANGLDVSWFATGTTDTAIVRIDVVEASMTARYSVDCLGPDTGSMAIDYADLGQPVASEFLLVSLSYGRAAVVSNPLGGLMEVWLQTAVKHAAIVQN